MKHLKFVFMKFIIVYFIKIYILQQNVVFKSFKQTMIEYMSTLL